MQLICLGVGTGTSNFLTGSPSSAYAIVSATGTPLMLMDCGSGVGRSAIEQFGSDALPGCIYVSHNHADHSGDLPVYLTFAARKLGVPLTLCGHPDVLAIVREHRLHELDSVGVDRSNDIAWNPGQAGRIDTDWFSLELVRAAHSYLCYGFVLSAGGRALLGWSSDCRYEPDIYAALARAPLLLVHARPGGTPDHAAFEEVDAFAAANPATRILVGHYGEPPQQRFRSANVSLLDTGDRVDLGG